MKVKKPSATAVRSHTKPPFVHYYDLHPTKEDLIGESAAQSTPIHYLLSVLARLLTRSASSSAT